MAGLNGYIKLHRKLLDWGWYSDSVVKDVFLHILLTAAFSDGQYQGYTIKAGQAVIGRKRLAEALGFSEQQIRTALKKLESTGEITTFSTNKFTIVTVENWGFYQCEEETSNQRATNEQPTNNQQITNKQPHLKNVKKVKNVKNVRNNIYIGVPDELKDAFMDFAEMRKKIKKPITTVNTVTRILNKLDKLATSTEEKIAILEQSVFHCWQDVYELKGENKTNGQHGKNSGNYKSAYDDIDIKTF